MEKQEVIDIMTGVVMDLNKQLAEHNEVPLDQIEEMLASIKETTDAINGLVYEKLKEAGVIS
jgi:hypothetical protein